MLALADANLRFICVDVRTYGSQGDALGRCLYEKRLHIFLNKPLPCTTEPCLSMVIVADEAFGLAENLMQPHTIYCIQMLPGAWLYGNHQRVTRYAVRGREAQV